MLNALATLVATLLRCGALWKSVYIAAGVDICIIIIVVDVMMRGDLIVAVSFPLFPSPRLLTHDEPGAQPRWVGWCLINANNNVLLKPKRSFVYERDASI